MNPTDLVFVFSSGCLSTCRVPGGGTCGQIPGGRVYSVTSRDAGGDRHRGHGEWGDGGAGGPHADPHQPTHPLHPAQADCTFRSRGLTAQLGGHEIIRKMHHCELTALPGA